MRPFAHSSLTRARPCRIVAPAMMVFGLQLGGLGACGSVLWSTAATAQEGTPQEGAPAKATEPPDTKAEGPQAESPKVETAPEAKEKPKGETEPTKRHRRAKKPAETPAAKPAETAEAPAAVPPVNDKMVEQLKAAGVKACLTGIVDLGKQTLGGVSSYGRAANWQTKTPDQRLASVILGQSYPEGAPLPKALALLLGAPAGAGKCDTYGVQVIPTKEKCADLQTKITVRGKKIGELSGIPFLNDVNKAQIMLLPGADDSCVLVALRIVYSE